MKNKIKFLTDLFLVIAFMLTVFGFSCSHVRAADEADIKKDINKIEDKIEKEEKELQQSEANLSVTQSQIKSTASQIDKAETEISRKEKELDNLEKKIILNKKILTAYTQEMYFSDQEVSSVLVSFSSQNFGNYFQSFDQALNAKGKVLAIMEEIKEDKGKIEEVKEELAEKKEEHEKLLAQKQAEKKEIVSDINEATATLAELKKKLVEMQSDLLALTGKSFSAKDIKEAVEYASKKTGVPKGVLYGFLKMETNLGANTGQCTYQQVKKDAISLWYGSSSKWKGSRDLLEKRMNIFYDLVGDLSYSKDKKVSCTPRSYRGQGGAMGVAQFMSDVWQSYESRIKAKTGSKTPNPWDLTDGVMAMAIKLQGAGATSDSKSAIKNASINYLGAFNQRYYDGIVYWSKNYTTLFN